MQYKTISKKIFTVLSEISQIKNTRKFYLAGGTSLALQIGHRESIDLDFFNTDKFKNKNLKLVLAKIGKLEIITDELYTLNLKINGVKVSFFYYPYKLLFPKIKFEKMYLADERDISTMKLEAIAGRGSKKDFIDLYFLSKKYTLEKLIRWHRKKYKNLGCNEFHIFKSLVYFADAESEPMPKMLVSVDWEEVKKYIVGEVKKIMGRI